MQNNEQKFLTSIAFSSTIAKLLEVTVITFEKVLLRGEGSLRRIRESRNSLSSPDPKGWQGRNCPDSHKLRLNSL